MQIASKYEDINPPEIKDYVYITDSSFTKEEILETEGSILKQIDYCLTFPSSFCFLERFARLAQCSKENFVLARYLIELCLVDYKMIRFSNSLVAAASVYLTHKIKAVKPEWNKVMEELTPYKESDIKACAKEICILFQRASKTSLQSVRNKFMSPAYFSVANTSLM